MSFKISSRLDSFLSEIQVLNLTEETEVDASGLQAAGGYCDVFVGKSSIPRRGTLKVAIKRLRRHIHSDRDFIKTLTREIHVWSMLNHKNVLPLLGFQLEGSGFPSLISEWMNNGTALSYVIQNPDHNILSMVLGISEGLAYIHDQGVIHSDIKAENVLMSPSLVPMICDFGISRTIVPSSALSNYTQNEDSRGTVPWMAVELLDFANPRSHSMMSDVWSFGMTIYELLTKKAPYSHLVHDVLILQAILAARVPTVSQELVNTWPTCYHNLWQLCQACWKINPIQRPTMKNVSEYIRLLDTSKRETLMTGFTCVNVFGEGVLHSDIFAQIEYPAPLWGERIDHLFLTQIDSALLDDDPIDLLRLMSGTPCSVEFLQSTQNIPLNDVQLNSLVIK